MHSINKPIHNCFIQMEHTNQTKKKICLALLNKWSATPDLLPILKYFYFKSAQLFVYFTLT